jgi:type II restriction enzyme
MFTHFAERAIADALKYGKAIMKPIVPNEIPGMTGSHQYGYYLPIGAWSLFTKHSPKRGENLSTEVSVTWQNGQITKSRIHWYGKGTRYEYRLTCFGRDFPYLTRDSIGDILVLIPISHTRFLGYVLEYDEEIEEIQNALGVELLGRCAVYEKGKEVTLETPQECVERLSRKFTETVETFPETKIFAEKTRCIISKCVREIQNQPVDEQLMKWVDTEYRLFRMIERKLCQNEVVRYFKDIDQFLATAQSILQRRKSRAGASLEHHTEHILSAAGIPFTPQSQKVDGKPDVIIPNAEAYLDPSFPVEKLCVLGVKTTCKDRWRQVTREAKRVPQKHILTLQKGISENQLVEMEKQNVTLVVPESLHVNYPPNYRFKLLSVEAFVERVQKLTA